MLATVTTFLLALATANVDGPNPEPPGAPLAKLHGTWKVRAVRVKGEEKTVEGTYTFVKDKATLSVGAGKGTKLEMKLVPDKARDDLFEMKKENGRSVRYFFKVEKGELYLTPVRPSEVKPKPDFSGDTSPVLILKPEKKAKK